MILVEPGAPWRVRRLSDAGLAEVTARYLDAQVLQTSAEYFPELLPGVTEGPGHGACLYTFAVASGDGPILVSSINWFGEAEETAYYVPSPERRELDEIAHELMGIEEGLGAGGWAESASRAYIGPSYLVWLQSEADPSFYDLLPTDGISWPFDGPLEAFGDGGFGEPAGTARCGYLDLPQAFEFARLFRELGADLSLDAWGGAALEADTGWLGLQMQPRTPDGYPTCADIQAGRRWGTP
jgi:hypothetical protein